MARTGITALITLTKILLILISFCSPNSTISLSVSPGLWKEDSSLELRLSERMKLHVLSRACSRSFENTSFSLAEVKVVTKSLSNSFRSSLELLEFSSQVNVSGPWRKPSPLPSLISHSRRNLTDSSSGDGRFCRWTTWINAASSCSQRRAITRKV